MHLVLDLGGSTLRSAFVNNGRLVVGSLVREEISGLQTPRQLANLLANKIQSRWQAGTSQKDIALSLAGPVNTDHRTVEFLPNILGSTAKNFDLASILEQEINNLGIRAKLHIINDGSAAVLAEMSQRGALARASVGFAYIIGTGIGGAAAQRVGGIIVPSDLFREFGHYAYVTDPQKAVLCGCGQKGCLETVSSGQAATRIANQMIKEASKKGLNSVLINRGPIDNKILSEAIKAKDILALIILEELTSPTAHLIDRLISKEPNIQVAFIGGFVLGIGEPYLQSVIGHIKNDSWSINKNRINNRLHLGKIPPDETNLIGAAEYGKGILVNQV